jgi:hypothetical protein
LLLLGFGEDAFVEAAAFWGEAEKRAAFVGRVGFLCDVAVLDEVHHALAHLRAEQMHAARDREDAAFPVGVQVAEYAQRGQGEVEAGDEFLVDPAIEDAACS